MIITITTSDDTPGGIIEDEAGELIDTESFDNPHSAFVYAGAVLMEDE